MSFVQRDELGPAGLDRDDSVAVFALAHQHAGRRVLGRECGDVLVRSCHRLRSLWLAPPWLARYLSVQLETRAAQGPIRVSPTWRGPKAAARRGRGWVAGAAGRGGGRAAPRRE